MRPTPLLSWRRLAAAGAACLALTAAEAPVTAITLERDCAGCVSGLRFELRRSGAATLTHTGKARLGSEDRVLRGHLDPAQFDVLARLLAARGFFAMRERYEDPQLQDGSWVHVTASRGGQDKQVFRREGAGPAGLDEIEAALDAARARIAFAPSR